MAAQTLNLSTCPSSYGVDRISGFCFGDGVGEDADVCVELEGDSWLGGPTLGRMGRWYQLWPRNAGDVKAWSWNSATGVNGFGTGFTQAEPVVGVSTTSDYVTSANFRNPYVGVSGNMAMYDYIDTPPTSNAGNPFDTVHRFQVLNDGPNGTNIELASTNGGFTETGDVVAARLVYLTPLNVVDQAQLSYGDGTNTIVAALNCRSSARPYLHTGANPFTASTGVIATADTISASFPDVELDANADTGVSLRVLSDFTVGGADEGKGLMVHNCVMYKLDGTGGDRVPGLYIRYGINDGSYSLNYLSTDELSLSATNKVVSNSQMKQRIAAQTIDPTQRVLHIWWFATENLTRSAYAQAYINAMARRDTLYEELGLPAPYYLLIGSPWHSSISNSDPLVDRIAASREYCENSNYGAYDAARSHPRAAFVSLGKLTGGYVMVADDRSGFTGAQSEWKDYIVSQGFDNWTTHPAGTQDVTTIDDHWDEGVIHWTEHLSAQYHTQLLIDEILNPSLTSIGTSSGGASRRSRSSAITIAKTIPASGNAFSGISRTNISRNPRGR